jgi:quercetin dioxygenase-like cupin family protein
LYLIGKDKAMPFEVYDFRTDIRNILVTPQIRSRFLRMEVGQVNASHTHDLGHEIFLILQGLAEFEIEGHKETLSPGQMCIALTDEAHIVRNVGDEPVIMYLSVTPHIQPTHTFWNDDGTKKPPRFTANAAYDLPTDRTTPTETLAETHLQAAETLAATTAATVQAQRAQMALFKQALADQDDEAALAARDAMWQALSPMFQQVYDLADAWNALTARTVDDR